MARITDKRFREIKERILHSGSYIEKEAFEMGIPKELLLLELERLYSGGKKNSQYKAVITTSERNASRVSKEELDGMRILPKAKPTRQAKPASAPAYTPAPAQIPAPNPAPAPMEMEELLSKKEEFQWRVVAFSFSLKDAEAILDIRQKTLTDAKDVFKKAEVAVQQAEVETAEAEAAVKETKVKLERAKQALQRVEKEIQELKEKTIYLVDPWFTGELPEYGTFLSTEKMEGVKIQEVPEDYLPEASLEGVLLFDFVPDYKKARIFCGLVAMYELEETPYQLLVSDGRVKALLEMYIGR